MTAVATPVAPDVDSVCDALDRDGYALVEGMMGADEVEAARAELQREIDTTPTGRNDFEGFRTTRIYALFAKVRCFDRWAIDPLVLGVAERVLGPGCQLSAPTGIQIGPGEQAQILHRDEQIYPVPQPHPPLVLNTMWPLCDFTAANGATMIVPASHRDRPEPPDRSEAVPVEMAAGSCLFYLGGLWHGGGANTTDTPRLGVILEYVAGWLRPQENHLLGVPRDVARTLPDRLQELLGYGVHPPFLGYVDGRHPRKYL